MLDWITIRGLRAFGFHGVFAEERRDGQEFVVDLRLGLAVRTDSDALPDTVDYSRISAEIVAIVESNPVNLIETLAGRLADVCLASPLVEQATVTVHKPSGLGSKRTSERRMTPYSAGSTRGSSFPVSRARSSAARVAGPRVGTYVRTDAA